MSSESECSSWFSSFGFFSLASPGSVHSCGMVLLYRPRFTLCNFFSDAAGRFICAEFSYNDISFHVVSLYAPNRNPDRDTFLQFVSERVDPGSPTTICGDFNTVFDRAWDRWGFAPASAPRDSSGALISLFRECCVVDVWRHLHPHSSAFTWLRPDGSFSSRIDLVGCPLPWLHYVESCDIIPCPYSDHAAVLWVCPIPVPLPRGRGAGNSTYLSSRRPSLFRRWKPSGRRGLLENLPPVFILGGTKAKGVLRALLSALVLLAWLATRIVALY